MTTSGTATRIGYGCACAMLLLWSAAACAHAWGNSYALPIPFSLYAYGATAALIISFVLVGYFAQARVDTVPDARRPSAEDVGALSPVQLSWPLATLKIASVFGLGLTIVLGLFGNASPFANFSMTFFWIVFVLGFMYLTALIGDLYSVISPWKTLCEWIEKAGWHTFEARRPYPERVGYWPAIILYGGFIWIELFGHSGPRFLGVALSVYTIITLFGSYLYGRRVWFQYGEFFGVMLRLVGRLAPVDRVVVRGRSELHLIRPFDALIRTPADHPSLTIFILFMLSSTAFDGAHETLPWVNIFWKHLFPNLAPLLSNAGLNPFSAGADVYYAWQWLMLAASPFIYYGVYRFFMWATRVVTGGEFTTGQLALHFAMSLVPIAFVYHVAHYFSLLLTEGPNIVALVSDPFGYGWNLFGTANRDLSIVPQAGVVWHMQVWLILAGHIISVYVAHMQALKIFNRRAQAVRSQLPMLFLMVFLTSLGLWILSLPIAAGQVSGSMSLD